MSEINHPPHYGGEDNPYEAIEIIEAHDLGFHLGNAVKYVLRAGKKEENPNDDVKKAIWYLERFISYRATKALDVDGENGDSVDKSEEESKPNAGRPVRKAAGRK